MRMRRSQGYTLIELMISVAMGVIMIAVAVQYLIGASGTFNATETLGRTQENARFALSIMARDLRMAGYGDPAMGDRPGFFFRDDCGSFSPCTADGGASNPDRLAVWMNPPPDDGSDIDCTASAVAADDQIANLYYLETADDGVTSLMCRGYNVSTSAWVATAQPMVDGVDNMQILYGVTNNGEISQFVSADAVANWSAVVSVRLVLLVSTGLENGSSGADTRSYELADSPTLDLTDNFNRRVFSTTVVINNAIL